MYFPYLRAKQYELKAIREFSASNKDQNKIIPIIEPVKASIESLYLAMKEMSDNGMQFALVVNPYDGDFKHPSVEFKIPDNPLNLISNRNEWIPALIVRNNYDIIERYIEDINDSIMLVFKSCADVENARVLNLIRNPKVLYIVNDFGSSSSRRTKRVLIETEKNIICLNDAFKPKTRNADYAEVIDEPFTEEFFYYSRDGFYGFSDYTTLGRDYIEGGMLPYALAIHMTYQRTEDQIFVHHFVSDSNQTNANIKRKFHEAAGKAVVFYGNHSVTPAANELLERASASDGYPGLGYLKKLSIKNHLELLFPIL